MANTSANCIERQSSAVLNDKSAKYDRQIRLWGNHGQLKLENSRICLVNASVAGTEALKSLVLPGVGYFNIIDDNSVSEEDVASNFFLTIDSIGQNRAKVASENLCELNPDVIGDYLAENVDRILMYRPEFFKSFNLVIATNLKENSVKKLAQYLWNEKVALIIIRSYGLMGYIRLILKEHTVIEAHPDNELPDLRLDEPFEELRTFCNSINITQMSDKEHSQIPSLIILYKYLEIWKSQNNGQIPRLYKEKEKFKELIRSGIKRNEDSVPIYEENFEEALKNVNNSITRTEIPNEIQRLFDDENCLNLNSESEPFWIIVRAIKEFSENEGQSQLPLRGTIPDMNSNTEKFVLLQNLYKMKAQQDVEAVITRVERLLFSVNKPFESINEHQVKLFCLSMSVSGKNSYFLKSIKYRSLEEEYDPQTSKIGAFIEKMSEQDDLIFYLLFRSIELFNIEFNRYPGTNPETLNTDVTLLKRILNKFLSEHSVTISFKEEFIHEMCRYGKSELHSVSSFLGGCVAHEAIKFLTNQFVPINNTLIYNGIKQSTTVYEL